MTNPLLTIGSFARLVGLTPSALRFYDDCGLLVPAQVDPASGYRLYAPDQEQRAVLLRDLRTVDLPLAQVRQVLDGAPEEAEAVLRGHVQSLEDRVAPARRATARVLASLSPQHGRCAVTLSGPELAAAARQVAPTAAADESVPGLSGALVELDGGEVRLVATDRYRLAVRVLSARDVVGGPASVLVPAADLAALTLRALRHQDVRLSVRPDALVLELDGQEHELTSLDAEFPDYRRLVAALAAPVARAVVDRARLLEVLVDGDLPGTVAVDLGRDRLRLSHPGGAEIIALDAVCTGTGLRLGFAPAVLAAALHASVGPDVMLELSGPDRPVVVRSADQGSFTTLAMPTLLTT